MTLTNHGSVIPPFWEYTGNDVMLYPGGRASGASSFHCEDCGCNVFKEVKFMTYECNGCGSWYKGYNDPSNSNLNTSTPETSRGQ